MSTAYSLGAECLILDLLLHHLPPYTYMSSNIHVCELQHTYMSGNLNLSKLPFRAQLRAEVDGVVPHTRNVDLRIVGQGFKLERLVQEEGSPALDLRGCIPRLGIQPRVG